MKGLKDNEELRNTGLDVIGDKPWGTHFCNFFETKQDLLDILIPYFKAGLENNEYCLWITSDPITVDDALQALHQAIPDFSKYLQNKSIKILPHSDWYLKDGLLDASFVTDGWKRKHDEAMIRGYRGMRVNGNAGWLPKELQKGFMEYEREFDGHIAGMRILVLCSYPLAKCNAGDVLEVARTHEVALSRSEGRWEVVEVNDVAEKLKAEAEIKSSYQQLKELTAHLQHIREEERTHIAREIHDELGQQLTGLKMDAAWIGKKITMEDKSIQEKLSSMISLIDETVKTVRRISSELRPGILDDLGLMAALEWQGQEFEKRTGIRSHFISKHYDFNPGRNLSTNIFRVYQEVLTNIARHANATRVETVLEQKEGYIRLSIKDNGRGFDVNEVKMKNSLGLIGMKERALMFQGELTIESNKPKGTVVILKVPLLKGAHKILQ